MKKFEPDHILLFRQIIQANEDLTDLVEQLRLVVGDMSPSPDIEIARLKYELALKDRTIEELTKRLEALFFSTRATDD